MKNRKNVTFKNCVMNLKDNSFLMTGKIRNVKCTQSNTNIFVIL